MCVNRGERLLCAIENIYGCLNFYTCSQLPFFGPKSFTVTSESDIAIHLLIACKT